MTEPTLNSLSRGIRRVASSAAILLIVLSMAAPLRAEIFSIDPHLPPNVILPPEEANLLETLLSADFPNFLSEISPDDQSVVTFTRAEGLALLDLQSGEATPIGSDIYKYWWLTDFRWRNRHTLVFIGADSTGAFYKITVKRETGAITAKPLELPGYPVSLSTRGKRLLLARIKDQRVATRHSPFKKISLLPGYKRSGPEIFDAEELMEVRVATGELQLAVLDLVTNREKILLEIPPDTALTSIAWSPNDSRLAIVRWRFPDNTRGGVVPLESDSVQDALGNLSPAENPFFTSNILDIFQLAGKKVRHTQVRPDFYDEEVFIWAVWDPSSFLLMTMMRTPSTLQGRTFPTYSNPNGSTYRFYLANGWLLDKLAKPEVDALFSWPLFVSPFEVVINAPDGLSFSLYHYNLFTRQLQRLNTPPGTIYQVLATHHRREILYNFGSFEQPYEFFRIKMDHGGPISITDINAEVANANRIRADLVSFILSSGVEREGYLIQPKYAAFPPENIPLVVWQEGGPTAPMTNNWGGHVEAPFNLLPNFGISLLLVPLQGRDGFGPQFLDSLADDRNFGQIDIDEQAEIVDQLIEQGFTSRDRVGITGCSYGGYFTSQSITSYPDAYAAANTQATLINLFDEWEFGYMAYLSYLMGCTPLDDQDEYFRDSPLQRADQVRTPTLIFAGSDDFLPAIFSRDFHDEINGAGTPADFYSFEGEGHGLSFFNSQFVAGQAQIEWFRQYLAH